MGVEWPYQRGGASRLLCWNALTGELDASHKYDERLIYKIAGNGGLLINSERQVVSTKDGTLQFERRAGDVAE